MVPTRFVPVTSADTSDALSARTYAGSTRSTQCMISGSRMIGSPRYQHAGDISTKVDSSTHNLGSTSCFLTVAHAMSLQVVCTLEDLIRFQYPSNLASP